MSEISPQRHREHRERGLLFATGDEQRVDEMIKEGCRIMQEAISNYRPVAIFGAFSGGDDSIVAAHFAVEHFQAAVAHANTLIGLQVTRQHIQRVVERFGWQLLEERAVALGPPATMRKKVHGKLIRVPFDAAQLPAGRWTEGDTAYEEYCFNFGMPGPGQHKRQYQRLKERSFRRLLKQAKAGHSRRSHVLFVSGIRFDESSIRAGYKRAVSKVGGQVWVNPFYYRTALDFEAYRQEFGLPRNPVKGLVGISGECLCGTMGDPSELEAIGKVEPSTKIYINSLESRCATLGLHCRWAVRPPKVRVIDLLQKQLFGAEPSLQPACVGCIRRQAAHGS